MTFEEWFRGHYGWAPEDAKGDFLSMVSWSRAAWAASERNAREARDAVYRERDAVVAALAECARRLGWRVGRASQQGEWEEDWRQIVLIDLPTGQASWHFHDSESDLFRHLPFYLGQWDGHTTPEKYARLRALIPAPCDHLLLPNNGTCVRCGQ